MRSRLLPFFTLLLLAFTAQAQRNCGSMEYLEQQLQENPARQLQLDQLERFTETFERTKAFSNGIITIPVIVHVVYNGSAQNISDAQIASQIQVLNDDFRRMNADRNNTPGDFVGVAADSEIEFCLTQTLRVPTSRSSFGTNDAVKQASSGGSDVINPSGAMNVWICNIGGGILGYAQFPGGPAATDGIVLDYRYVGTNGTATAPFDLGRTATHEVGHYLNLRHIWGDGGCNVDDFVSDTPAAGGPNYTGGSCTYPGPNSCRPKGKRGGDDLPDMFQNYMDYSDDGCMNLFTLGQKDRMWAAINASRPGLLSSACDGTPPPPPPATEICDNGIDDDGDGQIDCADGDCATAAECAPPTACEAPTGLTHTRRKGGREATLSWNAVSGADSYLVEVYSNNQLIASGTLFSTSASLGGLTKGQAYTWRVRSNCASSTSDWANSSFNARQIEVADGALVAFPNPVNTDVITLQWDLTAAVPAGISQGTPGRTSVSTITVREITGRVVMEMLPEAGIDRTTIQLADVAPGVYLVTVTTADGQTASTKLVRH